MSLNQRNFYSQTATRQKHPHALPSFLFSLCLCFAQTLIAVPSSAQAQEQKQKTYESGGHAFRIETLLDRGPDHVLWSFDFLPDGKILLTERAGTLLVFDPKTKAIGQVEGVPKVAVAGQGGLLEVRVHPDFKKNNLVYLSYAEASDGKSGAMTTSIGRGKLTQPKVADTNLTGAKLEGFTKFFSAQEPNTNEIHFGSRIEFDGKGHIYVSVGDRNVRERAQDLAYHNGKILRLNEDGTVPNDNPFVKRPGAKPEIWSYGHRNPQGLAIHPESGELWEAEMGPRGGDEVNLIRPGANYGWPVITYGREYTGPKIGEGTEKPGMEQPVAYWVPSISPSGIGFYNGSMFPKWKGNLFLGTLSGVHLRRLTVEGKKITQQEPLLQDLGARFRCVRQGPDGALYFATDGGSLSKLVPAK